MFGKTLTMSSAGGVPAEAELMRSTTLIAANVRKVMKVLDRRQKAETGKMKIRKESKRWLPWRKRRDLEIEEREIELAGKVGMTVDDWGCVVSGR